MHSNYLFDELPVKRVCVLPMYNMLYKNANYTICTANDIITQLENMENDKIVIAVYLMSENHKATMIIHSEILYYLRSSKDYVLEETFISVSKVNLSDVMSFTVYSADKLNGLNKHLTMYLNTNNKHTAIEEWLNYNSVILL